MRAAMRPEIIEPEVIEPEVIEPRIKGACVALVPAGAARAQLVRIDCRLTRPDPRFITHLIATAELSPQTRLLRRTAPEVANAAYRSITGHTPGFRMRQVA